MLMVNYNKLMEKLKEKGITTYTIRQKALIPQGTLAKLKMCSGATISLNVTVDKYTSYFPSLNISHNCLVSAIFSGTSSCNKWLITDVSST